MNLKLSKNQQEIGIVAIAISLLLIVITTLHFATAPKVEAPSEPRKKDKINPTFYSKQDLPKTHNHDKNKIYIYKLEQRKETEVVKVEEKKEDTKKITAIVTAYTNGVESTGKSPDHPAYGITASGRKTERYVTTACPPSIPLGTWIEIEGIGKRRCDDRGGAIKGRRFDVYMKNLDKALEFGKQELEVIILS
jgi:3D (Asp-Asp-Asp) domain-containing protein